MEGIGGESRARPRRSRWRMLCLVLAVNLVGLLLVGAALELGLRLFWHPRFWVHAEGWGVGSAFGPAGRKWWPESLFRIEGREFSIRFRSDARGYRARPESASRGAPYRIAFVGDSFTEAMQVEYAESFVARLEQGLSAATGRGVVGLNYGVAATGIFDYWHRIVHDVFDPRIPAPEMLVLCVFPENDFTDYCPEDGFDAQGWPKRDYYQSPAWSRHVLAWCDQKSKLAHLAFLSLHIAGSPVGGRQLGAPDHWWNEPAVAAVEAERGGRVAHMRSLLRAIEDECARHGTRLVLLVVPARNYGGKETDRPVTQICAAWGLTCSVIDVAADANLLKKPSRLVFPLDGHLNPSGHAFVAERAFPRVLDAVNTAGPNLARSVGADRKARRSDAVR